MATDLRLAQCLKCKGYTLLGNDRGLPIALDVTELDAARFGVAYTAGAYLYAVEKGQNGASRGRAVRATALELEWTPEGRLRGLHGFHESCPVREQRPVNLTPAGKAPAPATPGAPGAGPLPTPAPASKPPASPPAASASPRPSDGVRSSDVLGRCGICGRRVQPGQPYWSITHGRDWVDGQHVECP